jgi:phosphoadenosine phosphosulfate reductase
MAQNLRLVETTPADHLDLDTVNASLANGSPEAVLCWAKDTFGDDVVLTSSFGAESALMLHLATRVMPRIRVVFLDTGYLFPETYQFAAELTERFNLDLYVYSPLMSPARQEALYGKLWETDLARYHQINKIEPMDRALRELSPKAWIAGLRKNQTSFRSQLRTVERQDGMFKVHPILGWDEETAYHYMRTNDLPFHPLYRRGYRSIGDVHSTVPVQEGDDPRSGRRLGAHLECGIHLPRVATDDSMKSSAL